MEDPDYYITRHFPAAAKGGNGRVPWSFEHLPLQPAASEWKLRPAPRTTELRSTIKSLMREATVLVHAGDPDREGQLVVDQIIREAGWKKPVRRVLIASLDDDSVDAGIRDERDNNEFSGLSNAALARSRSDWLVGMNFTRAVTLQAQAGGFNSYVGIGRVQTPLLGLIYQRELEIMHFVPVDHYGLTATINVEGGSFKASWQPSNTQPGRNETGLVTDQRAVRAVQDKVRGRAGTIAEYKDETKRTFAELPFSLEHLQMLMAKKFGYRSEQTLSALQSLYDAKLTTYPRSDNRYLPESQLSAAPKVLDAIRGVVADAITGGDAALKTINPQQKSKAWNTSKVGAHHAIIPTTSRADLASLSPVERDVYREVCKRYAAQFMPPYEYRAVMVVAQVEGERFKATGSTPISAGWRALYGGSDGAKSADDVQLPVIRHGERATCAGLDLVSKRTEPPARFTESTLLDAMVNIHKFVTDDKVKAIFEKMLASKKSGDEEATCGIGTPATRHTFVPKLISTGMVSAERVPKSKEDQYKPTASAMALIPALPTELGRPDMTALWESVFEQIQSGTLSIDQFLDQQGRWIASTIDHIRAKPMSLPAAEPQKRVASGGKTFGAKSGGGSAGYKKKFRG